MKKVETYEIESISHLIEFLDIIMGPSGYTNRQFFRGQSNSEWPLIPSYFRFAHNLNSNIADKVMISNFKRVAKGLTHFVPNSDIEWSILAQHHGLPTRLLDWTYSPLVALFFALENPKKDGAIYHTSILDLDFEKHILDDSLLDSTRPEYITPTNITLRVSVQKSCFILMPYQTKGYLSFQDYFFTNDEKKETPCDKLTKLIISKGKKTKLKRQLDQLGINEFTLFPDLDGLAKYIKYDMEDI